MAKLRDVPRVIKKVGAWTFLKRVYARVGRDNSVVWASALAYSWLFAVFPFFVFLLSLLPYLPASAKATAQDRIQFALMQLPSKAYDTVWGVVGPRLDQFLNAPPPGLKGILSIGLVVTLWGASGGMAMTMAAMDRCYEVGKCRPYWVQRPLAILLTVVEATLIIAVILLIPIGTVITNWVIDNLSDLGEILHRFLGPTFGQVGTFITNHSNLVLVLWQVIRFSLAFVLMFAALAIIYHLGPNTKRRFRLVTPGAVFTVAVWMLLGIAFRLYIDRFGKGYEAYGAVGGVAVLLLNFYLDALVLLVGSEINAEIDYAVTEVPPGTRDFRPAEDKLHGPPRPFRHVPILRRWLDHPPQPALAIAPATTDTTATDVTAPPSPTPADSPTDPAPVVIADPSPTASEPVESVPAPSQPEPADARRSNGSDAPPPGDTNAEKA